MKKIVLKLYEFDELSKDSQERIIEREHWNVMEQCMDAYGIDYKKSMKAFEDMTDTRVYNWEVGYERYDFSYGFKYKDPIYEHPTDYHRDIFPENLCGKLLFRYINNNIMPYIIKGKYFSTSGKYIDGKYKYRHKYSRVMFDYGDNCPLTGMCYDYYLLKPIIDYYNAWCTYPEDFSLEDLMRQCYDNFFKSWHEEYEYWADNEDAIREEPENPMEWLPCPRCGLRPLVWEFDNGRATACGCGTDCYSHWSVQAESIMSVIKRSDNGKSAEAYDIDELKNNWNHWVRTGEILFTPGNGRW